MHPRTAPTSLEVPASGEYLRALTEGMSSFSQERGWPGALVRMMDSLDAAGHWLGPYETARQEVKLAWGDAALRAIHRRWAHELSGRLIALDRAF